MLPALSRPGPSAHRPRRGLKTALLAVLCTCPLPPARAQVDPAVPSREPIEAAVDTLLHGSPEDRLRLADEADQLFAALCDVSFSTDEVDHQGSLLGLEHFLLIEPDEWIGRTLLEGLAERNDDCEAFTDLFRVALIHPSPNYQRAALEWFVRHPDPGIEPALARLIRSGPPDWILPDLLTALMAGPAPARYVETVVSLADHPSPSVWQRAIELLGDSSHDRALAKLTDLARDGEHHHRVAALEALARWSASTAALRSILDVTHDENPEVRTAAIAALGAFEFAPAIDRLVSILQDRGDPARGTALHGLRASWTTDPRVAEAVTDILRESLATEGDSLWSQALSVLHNLDEPSVLPALTRLVARDENQEEEIRELIDYLGRDRDAEGRSFTFRSACSFGYVDPGSPDAFRILPPRGMRTVRCWQRPGAAWEAADEQRLPVGHLVETWDYFDLRGELWVRVDGHSMDDCWVPRALLDENNGRPGVTMEESRRLRRQEFDLPVEVAEAPPIRELIDAGLLIVIDPDPAVQGVALLVDPDLPLPHALAQSGRSTARTLTAGTIAEAVSLLCEHNELLCEQDIDDGESPGSGGEAEALDDDED